MAHVRGLQETGGVKTLRVVRTKAEPGKLTTQLARLDHQRSLLERQLAVWTEKQEVTRHRLHVVEKQMAEIGKSVRQLVLPRRKAKGRKRISVIATGKQAVGVAAASPRKEMNLEY